MKKQNHNQKKIKYISKYKKAPAGNVVNSKLAAPVIEENKEYSPVDAAELLAAKINFDEGISRDDLFVDDCKNPNYFRDHSEKYIGTLYDDIPSFKNEDFCIVRGVIYAIAALKRRDKPFKRIFLDYNMGEFNGDVLIEFMKKNQKYMPEEVVLISFCGGGCKKMKDMLVGLIGKTSLKSVTYGLNI